jgi:hypothetical protein
MPMIASTPIHDAQRCAEYGNSGTQKRSIPYVPSFSITPARITEPAVGASVCASGSQVWNGNIGTLMANAKKNPQNSHFSRLPYCAVNGCNRISRMSKVPRLL